MSKQIILITGGSGFIGTNLIEYFKPDYELYNIDIVAPREPTQEEFYIQGSVLDCEFMTQTIKSISPDIIIHLAAETAIDDSKPVERAYPVNVNSMDVLHTAINAINLDKLLVFSSQYVCNSSTPTSELYTQYYPYTSYGKSKVILEQKTKKINSTGWVICRPTYVWGGYFTNNFSQLCDAINGGKYLHPSGKPVIRTYVSIANLCWQVGKIIQLPLSGEILYLSDKPIDSWEFVNTLSNVMRGKNAKRINRFSLKIMCDIGEIINLLPIYFPLNKFRYKNMTTDYIVPIDKTEAMLGCAPYSLKESALQFNEWFQSHKHRKN
jgi:nucleoside-diphosphate-sugar epimerase